MFVRIILLCLVAVSSCGADANRSTLIGGKKVRSGEFEEVVWIRSSGSMCSAAKVGPRVILTAAHCVVRDEIQVIVGRNIVDAQCKIAPDYTRTVGDQDMALCKTDIDLEGPYASLSLVGPIVGDKVTLIGYGCIRPGGGGGNDGILRYGHSPVTKESTDEYYSFHTVGDRALCFGDSGGPAFRRVKDRKGHHVILGVNSRGNIQDTSLLTAVYHPKSQDFIRQFEVSEEVSICGYKLECQGSPKDDAGMCRRERRIVRKYERHLRQRQEKLQQCMDKHG